MWQLIPDYDRMTNDQLEKQLFHDDANITSQLVGDLIVSYLWRPLINDQLLDQFRAWISQPSTAPDFILIGK